MPMTSSGCSTAIAAASDWPSRTSRRRGADVAVLERNIATQQRTAGGAALRPHAKAHKSAEIAGLQLRAGAIGVMTATGMEALALARAGVPDILVGNIVRGAARCAAVADAATLTATTVLVDDFTNADELAAAARLTGVELDVLVDVDVGQHRTGARTVGEAVELARHIARSPGLRLRGVHGYEGHVRSSRTRIAGAPALLWRRTIGRRSSTRSALMATPSRSFGRRHRHVGLDRARPSRHRAPSRSSAFTDAAHWRQVPDPEASRACSRPS